MKGSLASSVLWTDSNEIIFTMAEQKINNIGIKFLNSDKEIPTCEFACKNIFKLS